jgi:hypothetical protein
MNGMQENVSMASLIHMRLGLMMIWGILISLDGGINLNRVMKLEFLAFLQFAMISRSQNNKASLIQM